MMKLYARTREREKAWTLGAYCLGGSVVLGPIVAAIAKKKNTTLFEISWTFSIILESVCVIPQLLLLRQTTVPTVIDSGYILLLGCYRGLYILNWIVRFAKHNEHERNPDWRAVIFGIIQTALYVDFAWVYYTRQRVKLRNGGVVDQDDLSRGFLVGKIFSRAGNENDEERGPKPTTNGESPPDQGGGRWGKRGISVSADDETTQPSSQSNGSNRAKGQNEDLGDFVDEDSDDEFGHSQPSSGLIRGQQ